MNIVLKLRQVEVFQGQGKSVSEAVRQKGVTVYTSYRWRKASTNPGAPQFSRTAARSLKAARRNRWLGLPALASWRVLLNAGFGLERVVQPPRLRVVFRLHGKGFGHDDPPASARCNHDISARHHHVTAREHRFRPSSHRSAREGDVARAIMQIIRAERHAAVWVPDGNVGIGTDLDPPLARPDFRW